MFAESLRHRRAKHPPPAVPAQLEDHDIISMTHFGINSWTFPPALGSSGTRMVQFEPRLVINSIRGAVASAVAGGGIVRVFSYHIAEELESGVLQLLLTDAESSPLPAHLIAPQGRLHVPKVRAFTDFAVPRLRTFFQRSGALG
jgi:DNA-binding transcriptional LysR family regulator